MIIEEFETFYNILDTLMKDIGDRTLDKATDISWHCCMF